MKFVVVVALILPMCLFAQDPGQNAPGNAAPPLLQRPYEAARDFLNVYAFGSATYDTNGYYVQGANSGAAAGYILGGGASGYHQWSTGVLELSYRGDYRGFASSAYPTGNDQNLTLLFRKDFNKRWSVLATVNAGIFQTGGGYYSSAPNEVNPSNIIQANPFSYETRFAGGDLTLSYQKSVRLSYQLTGSYFLTRYNGGNFSYGSSDITGAGSANYRLTRKTTLSGTYAHSYFLYQHNGGNSNVDSVYATVSYLLAPHWQVSGSGGITRANSNGFISIPVNVQIGNLIFPAIERGSYSQTSTLPYFQGSVVHDLRHETFSLSGGESVSPGTGYLLASKNLGLNGLWNHNMRRSNLSVAGYYNRLSSISNTASYIESTRGFSASYAYNLAYHIGTNARYDYINYSSFGSYGGRADNRFSLGFYISSKDVPLGLF